MIDISYEIGGKKINPNNLKDALERAVVAAVTDGIKKKIKSTRCLDHNGSARIKVKGRSLSDLSMEVSGCCNSFIEKVKKELS
ncbi:MAG: hypothetical protein PHY93_20265 [Bacteriovorax sp.]|nr:hypothetical protein [Bacteriovorax sp.]